MCQTLQNQDQSQTPAPVDQIDKLIKIRYWSLIDGRLLTDNWIPIYDCFYPFLRPVDKSQDRGNNTNFVSSSKFFDPCRFIIL